MTENLNPTGWPRGAGSIQKRGRVYWLIYPDADGRKIQASTGTDNLAVARFLLRQRAIETLETRLAKLKAGSVKWDVDAIVRILGEKRYAGDCQAGTGRAGAGRKDRPRAPRAARNRKANPQGGAR